MAVFLVKQAGAQADITDHSGLTPLHLSCLSGNVDIVRLLVEDQGVSIILRDNDDWYVVFA